MKVVIEIQKAKGGGYVVCKDGELAFAASTLPLAFEQLAHEFRTDFGEAVYAPHATVQRRIEEDEAPAPLARPSRKPPEVPSDRPQTYTMPNPKPDVRSLLDEQRERLNGHTTGMADRVPAVG